MPGFNDISSNELKKNDSPGFKEIKADSGASVNDTKIFWDNTFKSLDSPTISKEISKSDLSEIAKEYISDLKDKSTCPDTISADGIDISKLEKQPSEIDSKMREEFDDKKKDLRSAWEKLNHQEWPKYKEDIFNENGIRIRKAGDNYDAHHIQPLQLGGKNEVSNLTPLEINKHADVHSKDGSCTRLVEKVEELQSI